MAFRNQFDNKILFVLRGEHVQGASKCIVGCPASDQVEKEWDQYWSYSSPGLGHFPVISRSSTLYVSSRKSSQDFVERNFSCFQSLGVRRMKRYSNPPFLFALSALWPTKSHLFFSLQTSWHLFLFLLKKKKLIRKRVKFECIDQTTCERWLSVRSPAFSILSKTTKIAIRTMSRGTSYFISVCIRRQVFIKRFPANLSN